MENKYEIDVQGLEEGIRCAMCTNSMKSDRGCDGGCSYDKKVFDEVMKTLNERIAMRPNGKWINGSIKTSKVCSVCGKTAVVDMGGYFVESFFCPDCGADMRGVTNEE